jgi:hypothetical protein
MNTRQWVGVAYTNENGCKIDNPDVPCSPGSAWERDEWILIAPTYLGDFQGRNHPIIVGWAKGFARAHPLQRLVMGTHALLILRWLNCVSFWGDRKSGSVIDVWVLQ